jgi:hypothetical protein
MMILQDVFDAFESNSRREASNSRNPAAESRAGSAAEVSMLRTKWEQEIPAAFGAGHVAMWRP